MDDTGWKEVLRRSSLSDAFEPTPVGTTEHTDEQVAHIYDFVSLPQYNRILKGEICPYCKNNSEIIPASKYYRKEDVEGYVAVCRACDALVGCTNDKKPYGILAKRPLRLKRQELYAKVKKLMGSPALKSSYPFLHSNTALIKQALKNADISNKWKDQVSQITELSYKEAEVVLEFLTELENI